MGVGVVVGSRRSPGIAATSGPRQSPLDVLLGAAQILAADYRAGREFAFLAKRRNYPSYRDRFQEAVDALDRGEGRHMVEAVVLDGQMPRTERGLTQLQSGLDDLHRHFRASGLPLVLCTPPVVEGALPGGRPLFKLKRRVVR